MTAFEFHLPGGVIIDGWDAQYVVPRKDELVEMRTPEAPEILYRVDDVIYTVKDDVVEIKVVLRG